MLGGVCRLRQTEFGGRRPYRLNDEHSASGRWEIWMDHAQAAAVVGRAHSGRGSLCSGRQ